MIIKSDPVSMRVTVEFASREEAEKIREYISNFGGKMWDYVLFSAVSRVAFPNQAVRPDPFDPMAPGKD